MNEVGLTTAIFSVIGTSYLLMIRWLLQRFSESIRRIEEALMALTESTKTRDDAIFQILSQFHQQHERILLLLERLCRAWDLNGR